MVTDDSQWPMRRLGEVARYINGAPFKPSEWSQTGLPIIRIQNLSDPSAPFNRFAGELDRKFRVSDGDLLVSWSATLDVFRWNRGSAWLNQHIFRVEEDSTLVSRDYLTLAIKHALAELQAQTHGTTMLHIRRGPFEDTKIPVPPLAEQRRIVGRIEALTHRLEEARRTRESARAEAEDILTIAQRSDYERLLATEDSVPLGKVGRIMSGGTPAKSVEAYWDGDIPWIAPKEMKRFRIGESSMNVTQRAVDEGTAKLVSEPAVLMVVRGMILAKRVPIAVGTRPLTINQDMKAFVPRSDINVTFLGHMLCGAAEELYTRVEVAGHGTCKLETSAWAPLPIPVPKPPEQRRIVARLDALRAKVDEMQRLQREVETELVAFTPALLAKAFRGEL